MSDPFYFLRKVSLKWWSSSGRSSRGTDNFSKSFRIRSWMNEWVRNYIFTVRTYPYYEQTMCNKERTFSAALLLLFSLVKWQIRNNKHCSFFLLYGMVENDTTLYYRYYKKVPDLLHIPGRSFILCFFRYSKFSLTHFRIWWFLGPFKRAFFVSQ